MEFASPESATLSDKHKAMPRATKNVRYSYTLHAHIDVFATAITATLHFCSPHSSLRSMLYCRFCLVNFTRLSWTFSTSLRRTASYCMHLMSRFGATFDLHIHLLIASVNIKHLENTVASSPFRLRCNFSACCCVQTYYILCTRTTCEVKCKHYLKTNTFRVQNSLESLVLPPWNILPMFV